MRIRKKKKNRKEKKKRDLLTPRMATMSASNLIDIALCGGGSEFNRSSRWGTCTEIRSAPKVAGQRTRSKLIKTARGQESKSSISNKFPTTWTNKFKSKCKRKGIHPVCRSHWPRLAHTEPKSFFLNSSVLFNLSRRKKKERKEKTHAGSRCMSSSDAIVSSLVIESLYSC